MHVGLVCLSDIESGLDLANVLDEAGLAVTLYQSKTMASRLVGTSVRIIDRLFEMKLLPPKCKVRLFQFPRMRNPRSLAVIQNMMQCIHKDGVDVVHILMGPGELWLAVLACLSRKIPVVATMVIPQPGVLRNLPVFVIWAIHELLVRGSDLIIVNGQNLVPLVSKLYGIHSYGISYVPLCPRITATKWSTGKQREEPGKVLFFGKAHPRKGLEYLIRAQPFITQQVPHARIVISAFGEELDRCRRMIRDASKFEIHAGYAEGPQMASFYERASLVALPYLTASTSGIVLDAYSFGKPVVATTVGSLPEYVKDGFTGLLVPPGDEKQLAHAIIRLLSNDDLRHRMGDNARRWVEEEKKKIASETMKVYERVASFHNKKAEHLITASDPSRPLNRCS